MPSKADHTSSEHIPSLVSNKHIKSDKPSRFERILSAIFDGHPGTAAAKAERELKEKFEEDKLDIPRTEKEERERRARMMKRGEIVGGGDGVRHNDMQKGGWGGAALGGGFP